jgi:gluconolactonase
MYGAPEEIGSEVFARLPDALRVRGQRSEWRDGQPGAHAEHSMLEGPSFALDGTLYCVDIAHGRIFAVDSQGEFRVVADYDGEPNGLKIHRDGRLFVADYKNGLVIVDPETGSVEPYLQRFRLERFKAVNDLVFSTSGDLYFTDQGLTGLQDPTGRVFRVSADGRAECLIDNIPSPNGIVLDPTETMLYVAVTRANSVWRLPLLADGGVAKVGNFIQLSGGTGPDGLAVDADGNLAVAHVGLGTVWLFSALGEPLLRVRSCEGLHTTNMAYGGPDGRTLFITESASGHILMAPMPVAGRPMFSHT